MQMQRRKQHGLFSWKVMWLIGGRSDQLRVSCQCHICNNRHLGRAGGRGGHKGWWEICIALLRSCHVSLVILYQQRWAEHWSMLEGEVSGGTHGPELRAVCWRLHELCLWMWDTVLVRIGLRTNRERFSLPSERISKSSRVKGKESAS